MTPAYEVDVPATLSDDAWFVVRGNDLEHDIEVKVRLLGPNRPAVFAVRIDDEHEVTSRHLRSLRLPAIARAVFDTVASLALDLQLVVAEVRHLQGHQGPLHDLRGDPTLEHELAWRGVTAQHLQEWMSAVEDATSDLEERPRGRGARAPSHEDFRTFARVYLAELAEDPSGVVPRTAKRMHMTRPTAYRWLEKCRESGLVPPRKDL